MSGPPETSLAARTAGRYYYPRRGPRRTSLDRPQRGLRWRQRGSCLGSLSWSVCLGRRGRWGTGGRDRGRPDDSEQGSQAQGTSPRSQDRRVLHHCSSALPCCSARRINAGNQAHAACRCASHRPRRSPRRRGTARQRAADTPLDARRAPGRARGSCTSQKARRHARTRRSCLLAVLSKRARRTGSASTGPYCATNWRRPWPWPVNCGCGQCWVQSIA